MKNVKMYLLLFLILTLCACSAKKTEEAQVDISFEHLWKTYNHPKSIREIAEITWNEFSEEEKEAAIEYIPKYRIEHAKDKHFPYLAKYLRQKPWQCDGKEK